MKYLKLLPFILLVSAACFGGGFEARGVNLSFRSIDSIDSLLRVKEAGADSVRIGLFANIGHRNDDRLVLEYSPLVFNEKAFEELDKVLQWARSLGLKVILDMHSWPKKRNGEIWVKQENWSQLIRLWTKIFQRYAERDLVYAYDLMNEPNVLEGVANARNILSALQRGDGQVLAPLLVGGRDYYLLIDKLINKLREVDSKAFVIIGAPGFFGSYVNFNGLRLVADPVDKAVYSFHFYEPKKFVNQGKRTKYGVSKKIGVKYPNASMNISSLKEMLSIVRSFQEREHAEIYVGEFGVGFPTESLGGAEWIKDVVDIFNCYGWGWSYWSFSVPFRDPYFNGKNYVSASARADSLSSVINGECEVEQVESGIFR